MEVIGNKDHHVVGDKCAYSNLYYDMVSDKGWKLGARRHKINYNFF